MNDPALQWLTEHASQPGTLACGLRRPDGQFICHSVSEAFPAAVIEKILGDFDALAAVASVDSSASKCGSSAGRMAGGSRLWFAMNLPQGLHWIHCPRNFSRFHSARDVLGVLPLCETHHHC